MGQIHNIVNMFFFPSFFFGPILFDPDTLVEPSNASADLHQHKSLFWKAVGEPGQR